MPLYQVVPGQTARAADLDQYYNLLTGLAPDQPVSIAQLMTIVGRNLSLVPLTTPNFGSAQVTGATGVLYWYWLVAVSADGDAVPSASISASAAATLSPGTNYITLNWSISGTGPGSGASEFKILRNSVNTLGTAQLMATEPAVEGQTNYSLIDSGGFSLTAYVATTAAQAIGLGGAIEGGIVPIGFNLTSFGVITPPSAIPGTPFYFVCGSVSVTPNGSGVFTITLAEPFPNGLLTALFTPGDLVTAGETIQYSGLAASLSVLTATMYAAGVAFTGGGAHRVNFLAIGY